VAAIRHCLVPSDAVRDAAAVETAVDAMRQYIHDLYARRETELRAQPGEDTPLRAAVRENAPVVEELAGMSDRIASLTTTLAPRSMT
jgi:hypothetical protein